MAKCFGTNLLNPLQNNLNMINIYFAQILLKKALAAHSLLLHFLSVAQHSFIIHIIATPFIGYVLVIVLYMEYANVRDQLEIRSFAFLCVVLRNDKLNAPSSCSLSGKPYCYILLLA